jgi:hypothetical protein
MSTEKNAYELLEGTPNQAMDSEICKAYRTRSLKLNIHPDLEGARARRPRMHTRQILTCSAVSRRRTITTPMRVRPFRLFHVLCLTRGAGRVFYRLAHASELLPAQLRRLPLDAKMRSRR